MSERIKDEELKGLAEIYNSKGRNHFYSVLRNQYEIKSPYFVFRRMKNKPYLAYDTEKDRFLMEASLTEADEVFMSMEELCAPVVSHHELPGAGRPTVNRPEAMKQLVQELIGDRLLELSRYVAIDPLSKTMIIDKTSLESDGYQLVTH